MLQGAEILTLWAKRGIKQEMDTVVINKEMKCVINIEAKLTLSNAKRSGGKESTIESALSQIARTKYILNNTSQGRSLLNGFSLESLVTLTLSKM